MSWKDQHTWMNLCWKVLHVKTYYYYYSSVSRKLPSSLFYPHSLYMWMSLYLYPSCSTCLMESRPFFTPPTHEPVCQAGRSDVACKVEGRNQQSYSSSCSSRHEAREGGKKKRKRKGTHSWWISPFGLWPRSHPITFKLAAACKTLHISYRAPHPLWGPCARQQH